METVVVNVKTDEFDVYIGRWARRRIGGATICYPQSPFANPVKLEREADREAVLERYRAYVVDRMRTDEQFARELLALEGKRLGCWCKPKLCHGDVLVELINASRRA